MYWHLRVKKIIYKWTKKTYEYSWPIDLVINYDVVKQIITSKLVMQYYPCNFKQSYKELVYYIYFFISPSQSCFQVMNFSSFKKNSWIFPWAQELSFHGSEMTSNTPLQNKTLKLKKNTIIMFINNWHCFSKFKLHYRWLIFIYFNFILLIKKIDKVHFFFQTKIN